MAYDLQEQEQLAEIKAWWEKHGNLLTSIALAALVAIAAWNGWGWYQRREAAAAAGLYNDYLRAQGAHDIAREKEITGTMLERYGGTVFAALAALRTAKTDYDAKDSGGARALLQWVVDKSGQNDLALTARVRLAGILLDDKAYDAALKMLDVTVPASHAVVFADRRGDIYAAQGKLDLARAQWQAALGKADGQNALRDLVQSKLDALPNG
jgi:predicted negative regulator of RcsB-dependent stress response